MFMFYFKFLFAAFLAIGNTSFYSLFFLVSGYPLAFLYRLLFYGRSPTLQHLFFIATGLGLCYFNFGKIFIVVKHFNSIYSNKIYSTKRLFFIICRRSSFVQELWLDFVCYYCLLFSNHLKKTILFKSNCDKIPLNLVCLNISRKRAPKFTNVVGFINTIMVDFRPIDNLRILGPAVFKLGRKVDQGQ